MTAKANEVRVVGKPTGRRRLSFRASLFGPRPYFEAEHFVVYYNTNPLIQPRLCEEWAWAPVWHAYALSFMATGDTQ